MLQMLEKIAEEKLGSKSAAQAFVGGFMEKVARMEMEKAADFTRFLNGSNKEVVGAGAKLGAALLGAAIVGGIGYGTRALNSSNNRAKFERALQQVKMSSKVVKSAKPDRVQEIAETIFKFAPHVAGDVNLLTSILNNALLGDGIDPMTVKSLVDLEGRYHDNMSPSPLIGIKT